MPELELLHLFRDCHGMVHKRTVYDWLDETSEETAVFINCKAGRVTAKELRDYDESTAWHFRRWAEQAYTAIHGRRR